MAINKADLHQLIDALPDEFLELMFAQPDKALAEVMTKAQSKSDASPALQGLQTLAEGLIAGQQK